MREGVGVGASLRWVSQRFAQRALTEYFAGRWREFLIDAGTAVEHAAKAVVAQRDPVSLIVEHQRGQLTETDRVVLRGRSSAPQTSVADWQTAIERVVVMPTIRGSDAVSIVHDDFDVALDVDAATALLHARNAAAHLGDADIDQVDRHAAVLIASMNVLWSAIDVRPAAMWGYLAPVATVDHLRSGRTLERDADIRMVLARQRPFDLGLVDSARRSSLPVEGSVTCPACRPPAFRTPCPAHPYATLLGDTVEPHEMVDILDCLLCDLVLIGPQIDYVLSSG